MRGSRESSAGARGPARRSVGVVCGEDGRRNDDRNGECLRAARRGSDGRRWPSPGASRTRRRRARSPIDRASGRRLRRGRWKERGSAGARLRLVRRAVGGVAAPLCGSAWPLSRLARGRPTRPPKSLAARAVRASGWKEPINLGCRACRGRASFCASTSASRSRPSVAAARCEASRERRDHSMAAPREGRIASQPYAASGKPWARKPGPG